MISAPRLGIHQGSRPQYLRGQRAHERAKITTRSRRTPDRPADAGRPERDAGSAAEAVSLTAATTGARLREQG